METAQSETPRHRRSLRAARAFLATLALVLVVHTGRAFAQQPLRTLSGVVTDRAHEPLKGAVVEIVNVKTQSVESYLTDSRGHYSFKRLEAGTDYQFSATYRGHRSKTKRLGMFDSKAAESVALTINLH